MTSDKIVTLDDSNFDREVLEAGKPVLVDFWAEWCGPCRIVAPVLEDLAEELGDRLQIAKLNVDDHQDLAIRYNVSSIPTFILFKDGQVADRMLGAMPKGAFHDFLGRHV